MKNTVITLALSILLYLSTAAQIMIGEKSRIQDENGKILTFANWQALMQTGEYGLKELRGKKDAFTLYKLTPEEKERMMAFMNNASPENGEPMPSPFFKTGEPITPFQAPDISGKSVDITALRGKVVVLNFWFVGCAPCRQEIPELNKLVDRFSPTGDVEFVSIALDKKPEILKMLKKLPFQYRHIPDGKAIANDKFGVTMFPTHVIINKDGKIAFHTSGLSPNTIGAIEKSIAKALL